MIIHNCEQYSDAWFDAKGGRVTGSRFGALMTYEDDSKKALKSATFQNLVAEVAAEILTGKVQESYTNDTMQRGMDIEPEARREYEQLFEVKVDQVGFVTMDENHELYEWIGYSPDGLVEDGLLEIKCPLVKTHFNYIEANQMPSEYKWQVQGGLWICSDKKYCDFMSYFPGLKSFIIRVYPDPAAHEKLYERMIAFIEEVNFKILSYKQYTIY